MARWTPHRLTSAPNELPPCPLELHERFSVIGPDGKRYPTWHPPSMVDPASGRECTFGHEHGQDPSGFAQWRWLQAFYAHDADRDGTISDSERAVAGIPFGYVAEQLDGFCSANAIAFDVGRRHEDHVGHKIAYANQLQRSRVGGPNAAKVPIDLYCDSFAAFHQGTHSADAFRNSVHEMKAFVHCNGGSLADQYPVRMALNVMGLFGRGGGFLANDRPFPPLAEVVVGTPTPPNTPVAASGLGSNEVGVRAIPTVQGSVLANMLVADGRFSSHFDEDWNTSIYLTRPDGGLLAYTSFGLEVLEAPRIFDAAVPEGLRRSVDLCYLGVTSDGRVTDDPALASQVVRRARGGACASIGAQGPATPRAQRITWDDPRSPYNGCRRTTYFGLYEMDNAGGPNLWYTDPYGRNASRTWFPGSVKQWIGAATVRGSDLPFPLEAEAVPFDHTSCDAGRVRAPN